MDYCQDHYRVPCDDIAAEGRAMNFPVEESPLNKLMIKFECVRLPFCHADEIQYHFTIPPQKRNRILLLSNNIMPKFYKIAGHCPGAPQGEAGALIPRGTCEAPASTSPLMQATTIQMTAPVG
jgi:hypothetical protein